MEKSTTIIDIDRLSLRLSGLNRDQAVALVQLIQDGLVKQSNKIGPFRRNRSADLGNITLRVTWNSQQSLSGLANQAVTQLIERVNQSVREER